MVTSLKEIYDLFMMMVTDYRLEHLYNTSEEDFEAFLEAWLKFAIVEFRTCSQSLCYNQYTKMFDVRLTEQNKYILAKLMMKHWLQKLVNDITQMNLHVTDRDFRVASEAMNLREKSIYLNSVKEECSQLLNDYAYENNNWENWLNQDFL